MIVHRDMPFVESHVLGDKSLQVEDLLCTHLTSVFVERSPLDDFWLQCVICFGYQLPGECLDDCSGIDAVG